MRPQEFWAITVHRVVVTASHLLVYACAYRLGGWWGLGLAIGIVLVLVTSARRPG